MPQRELAELCGFTTFQVSKYENGKNEPGAGPLEQMSRHLEVSADYLLGITDDPQGVFTINTLNADEEQIISSFRAQGWKGLIRLIGERLPE
jgi:transcriptional regulator with XRE-family HTH domain